MQVSISVHTFYCVWNYIPRDHKIDSAHHDFIFVFIMEFIVPYLFYIFLITYTYSHHYNLIMFISTRFISHPDNLLSHFNHLQKVRNPLKHKNTKSRRYNSLFFKKKEKEIHTRYFCIFKKDDVIFAGGGG